jgi:Flp pilus assembly protein TadG
MRRANLSDDEAGSAALEFIFGGLILLVPIVYLVVALGMIQHQTLGAEAGARHIARAIAASDGASDAQARSDAILATVVEEYGIDRESVEISVRCAGSSACPAAGATVVVTLATRVALPLVPPVFSLERVSSIPVEASAAQRVSRFWSDG